MDTSLGMFLAWLALGLFDVAGVGFMMVGKFLGIATLTDIGWLLKAGGSKSSRHDAACGACGVRGIRWRAPVEHPLEGWYSPLRPLRRCFIRVRAYMMPTGGVETGRVLPAGCGVIVTCHGWAGRAVILVW